jgi:hypothetical protein
MKAAKRNTQSQASVVSSLRTTEASHSTNASRHQREQRAATATHQQEAQWEYEWKRLGRLIGVVYDYTLPPWTN